jgi:hypothetical protein
MEHSAKRLADKSSNFQWFDAMRYALGPLLLGMPLY